MANYRKFGKLVKIDGSSTSKWKEYSESQVLGNIVFANLSKDASTTDASAYPAGYYVWANGIEYKVANLADFDRLEREFKDYVAATNASIGRLDTSMNNADASILDISTKLVDLSTNRVKKLEDWKDLMGFVIGSTDKTIEITGVGGKVKFTGTNYVNVAVDGSTFDVSLNDSSIHYGDATHTNKKLATDGYVEQKSDELETRIDTSMGVMNTSISNISTRLNDTSTRMSTMVDNIVITSAVANNVATVNTLSTEERGTTHSFDVKIKGDNYINITSDTDSSIKLDIHVKNTSGGLASGDASLATTGAIVDFVNAKIDGLEGALEFKGEISSEADLVAKSKACGTGDTYVINNTSGGFITSGGESFENGDLVIFKSKGTSTSAAAYVHVQRYLTGEVTTGGILTDGHVALGAGKQTLKDSSFTLGERNSSDGFAANDWVLATEKAAKSYTDGYTDGKIASQTLVANASNAVESYFVINGSMYEAGKFRVESGINVTTFVDTTSSTTAGISLADAATFKKAIEDVTGILAVETLADASANIILKMTGGDTSIKVNGSKYVIVEKGANASTLSIGVKASTLANASAEADGLAIASDVSTIITANELATATAFAKVKESVGLTDGLSTDWGSDIKTRLGVAADTSVAKVVEVLDAHVDASIVAMKVSNTDAQDSIMVGISEDKGIVTAHNASLYINDVAFKHTVGQNVSILLKGADISVGGTSRHANSSIATAITDLSTAIDSVGADYLKTVTGDAALVITSGTTHAEGSYVSVSASATVANNTNLDTSVLVADVPDISTTHATASGLATDAYVKDYISSILDWEEI